jgi:hypothetical protein
MLVTSGCIGSVNPTDGEAETDPGSDALGSSGQAAGPAVQSTRESSRPATIEIRLSLEETSRIPLSVEGFAWEPKRQAIDVDETTGRLVPGETTQLATITVDRGTRIPASTLEVVFFDGLGSANLTVLLDPHTVESNATETITLADDGPGKISFLTSTGPFSLRAEPRHAVPNYGYLVWPNGDRRPLPGFDHVIQVPEGYPSAEDGDTVRLAAEVAEDEPVLWRVDDEESVEGRAVEFEATPGQHNVRVSVGPGESATDLTVHTDYERRVNGTVVAATPTVDETVEPVNGERYEVPVETDAVWVQASLKARDHDAELGEVDVHLLSPDGTVIDSTT